MIYQYSEIISHAHILHGYISGVTVLLLLMRLISRIFGVSFFIYLSQMSGFYYSIGCSE